MNKALEQTRKNIKSNDRIGDQKANLYHFSISVLQARTMCIKIFKTRKGRKYELRYYIYQQIFKIKSTENIINTKEFRKYCSYGSLLKDLLEFRLQAPPFI